jgi:glutathione S-transferase
MQPIASELTTKYHGEQVAILLEELGLPFQVTGPMNWKSESYLAINPNGRAPSIEDPNTGVIMFEVFCRIHSPNPEIR